MCATDVHPCYCSLLCAACPRTSAHVWVCAVFCPQHRSRLKEKRKKCFTRTPRTTPTPPTTGVEQPCEDTVTQPQMSGCRAAAAQRHFRLLFISEGDATMSASNIKHAVITLNQRLASDGAASERSDSSHITDERTPPIPAPGTQRSQMTPGIQQKPAGCAASRIRPHTRRIIGPKFKTSDRNGSRPFDWVLARL